MSLEEDKQKLRAAVKTVASCLEDLPRTDYLICAVTRSDDLEHSVCGLYSNLCWHDFDEHGRLKPPSIGMMVDLLIEARVSGQLEKMEQGSWRDREAREGQRDRGQ